MHPPPRLRFSAATAVAAATLLTVGCGPTIEEDEPRALVERRIEPCRERCTVQLDPECGARPEDHPFRTVDACVEDCAAVEDNGWRWAHQADGTVFAALGVEDGDVFTHVDGASLASPSTIEDLLLDLSTTHAWRLTFRRSTGSTWRTLELLLLRGP